MDYSNLPKRIINSDHEVPDNINRRLKKLMDYDRKPSKLNKTKNYKSLKRLMKDFL